MLHKHNHSIRSVLRNIISLCIWKHIANAGVVMVNWSLNSPHERQVSHVPPSEGDPQEAGDSFPQAAVIVGHEWHYSCRHYRLVILVH